MKTLFFIASLSVVLVLVLAACGSADTATPDPVSVLQDYYQALSSNDLDKAMSYVADDAVFLDPMGKYVGKENIRDVYAAQMNIGGKWVATNIKDTNGKGRLVYDFNGFINDSLVYSGTALTVVKDGKIIFDGAEYHWTAECNRDPTQSFCAD
jgi:ketosteroid isomerase-like protein